jgi:drug/metabolite transporter (DMT)-like permease
MTAAAHPSSSPAKAVAAMACGAALLAGSDAATKYLTQDHPVGQVLCLRQAATLLVILPVVAWTAGWTALRVRSWSGQLGRGMLFVATAALMVLSLSLLPLTTVTAVVFSSPIFVALLSAVLLGERVGGERWVAILIGFAGVLLIVRPAGGGFEWALLVPVAAAVANALRDIVTRRLSRTETSAAILFWSTLIVMLAGLATAPFGWSAVTPRAALWFVVAGAFNAGAHFLMIEALRLGEASLVTPFRYTTLVWAMLLGYFVWRELPDAGVTLGALLIIAGGLYALHTERKK